MYSYTLFYKHIQVFVNEDKYSLNIDKRMLQEESTEGTLRISYFKNNKFFINVSILTSIFIHSVQFSSVAQSRPTLCNPMNRSTPGLPVYYQLPESTQTHVHWVGNAIQPSHPLLSTSPPALNFSQHQGLFKLVSSSHQMAEVLEFQLQHQSFQ